MRCVRSMRAAGPAPRATHPVAAVKAPRTTACRAYSTAGSDRIEFVTPKSFFAGSGKNAVLFKLQNMGYTVRFHQFYKHFAAVRFDVNRQFCNKIHDSILKGEAEYKAFRSNVLVYSRSPLSPYVYTKSPFFLDWMREINKLYNVGVVICNADIIQVQVRLAERENSEKVNPASPAPGAADNRTFLGEMNADFLRHTAAEYNKLLASPYDEELGVCSAIHTTSTKQGTTALITQLGVKYQGFDSKV